MLICYIMWAIKYYFKVLYKKLKEEWLIENQETFKRVIRPSLYDLDEKISEDSNSEIRRVIRPDLYNSNNGFSENLISDEEFDKLFPIIPASTLSLDDHFFKWESDIRDFSKIQSKLKDGILNGKLKDFRRPIMDPSLDEFENIVFQKNAIPFTFKSCDYDFQYVKNKAEAFMPSKNSRIGNILEYCAFLAFLIKYLVENEKYSPVEAIKLVCFNSKKLVYDFNPIWEDRPLTGTVKVWHFYDLGGGTNKLLYEDHHTYYASEACQRNVATTIRIGDIFANNSSFLFAVPWIVMDV